MTVQPLDTLVDLDWRDIACQNPMRECDHCATQVAEVHAVHQCENVDSPFGNVVELLCDGCVDELRAQVDDYLEGLNQRSPGRVHCFTCGAPIAEPSDILRSVRPIT